MQFWKFEKSFIFKSSKICLGNFAKIIDLFKRIVHNITNFSTISIDYGKLWFQNCEFNIIVYDERGQ